MILLDTHALVWLDEGSPRLGPSTIAMADRALADDRLAVSAITFWEVAMLAAKNRLRLEVGLSVWRQALIENGLNEIPVTGDIGIRAARLADFQGDPADRLIVATAIESAATLVTADRRILAWSGYDHNHDARR